MDKILILGASGFSGRYFQQYILQNRIDEQFHIIGVDLVKAKVNKFDYKQCDLLDDNDQLMMKEIGALPKITLINNEI